MIGLRELRLPDAMTWDEAAAFVQPAVTHYRIADDCLRGEPDHDAIVEAVEDGLVRLTYRELDHASARLANSLVAAGLRPGDRVGVKLSQSIDMAVAVIGVLRSHGVVVPLSNVLAESGLRHRLTDSQPAFVIATGTPEERALTTEVGATLIPTAHTADGERTLGDITRSGSTDCTPRTPGLADEHALLLYTSGTTGKPKGVLHGQRVVLGHHAIDLAWNRVRADDVAYSPVDWTWAGGLLLGLLVPLAHGLTVVAKRDQHFDAAKTFDLMRVTNVSIGLFPPTVLRMMRNANIIDAASVASTSLRCFITGAEAVEPELIAWASGVGIAVNNAYGQTEANSLIGHASMLGSLDQRTMGRPYPGHEVAILDDDLRPCPVARPGQLAVRADDLVCMIEYWRAPEATAAKTRDGWLLTGDTAEWNPDGTISFHGRSDDIIKSGAYRLGPAEIEAAVLKAPEVRECAVIGLPDAVRGQVVSAVVVLAADVVPSEALSTMLRDLVRNSVGAHAYPRDIRYAESLPRTTTGKIDRAGLLQSIVAASSTIESRNP